MDLLWILALFVLFNVVGLRPPFAAVAAALIALIAIMPVDKMLVLVRASIAHSVLPETLGALMIIVFGAALRAVGTVQTFPEQHRDTEEGVDRSAWFSGGMLGAPLPVAVPLILACIFGDISIGQSMLTALIPGLALSLIYLLVFVLRALRGGPTELRQADGSIHVAFLVFRILLPILACLFVFPGISAGILTPTEAIAVMVTVLMAPALVCAGITDGGWRRLSSGLAMGIAGAGYLMLLLIGFLVLSRALAMGGSLASLGGLGLPPMAAMLLIVAIGLGLGTIVGPLPAVAVMMLIGTPIIASAQIDRLQFATVMFLLSESVRVGPRIWHRGFMSRDWPSVGGGVSVAGGAWPYYAAAVLVTLGYSILVAL